jgi:hypothetical protein
LTQGWKKIKLVRARGRSFCIWSSSIILEAASDAIKLVAGDAWTSTVCWIADSCMTWSFTASIIRKVILIQK